MPSKSGSLKDMELPPRKAPIARPVEFDVLHAAAAPTGADREATASLTVKLPQSVYSRLLAAGVPRPGQPRKRSNQEMMLEMIEEGLARRGQ